MLEIEQDYNIKMGSVVWDLSGIIIACVLLQDSLLKFQAELLGIASSFSYRSASVLLLWYSACGIL